MNILVAGANGQLGQEVLRAIHAESNQLSAAPLCRSDLDVLNLESIPPVLRRYHFGLLVNCTSYHKTDEVERNASQAFSVNAQAVQSMARVCREQGARFVHISTDYVFDGAASRPYVETDAPAPINVYGASKFLGEKLALREHPEGTFIVRVASLFGVAGSSGKGGNFVETMLRLAKEKGEVRVVDDIRMSPTSTADAARVILSLIEKSGAPGVYHVVNSGEASWFEFAREIIERAGIAARVIPITSREFPTVALRPAYSVLDNRKAAALAGEIPSWQDALDRYLADKGHSPAPGENRRANPVAGS